MKLKRILPIQKVLDTIISSAGLTTREKAAITSMAVKSTNYNENNLYVSTKSFLRKCAKSDKTNHINIEYILESNEDLLAANEVMSIEDYALKELDNILRTLGVKNA